MKATKWNALVAVLLALTLVAAACGGREEDSGDGDGGGSGGSDTTAEAALLADPAQCENYEGTQGVTEDKILIGNSLPQSGLFSVFDKVRVSRFEQDNEQWHLLILEELLHDHPERLGFVRHRLVPQLLAFGYDQLLVSEHPEWEDTPYEGSFNDDYGDYASLADLFRQIGYDERLHKLESEGRMERARFD
jgi:hypothetical protein